MAFWNAELALLQEGMYPVQKLPPAATHLTTAHLLLLVCDFGVTLMELLEQSTTAALLLSWDHTEPPPAQPLLPSPASCHGPGAP